MSISLTFPIFTWSNQFKMIWPDTYNIFTEMIPFHAFRWLAYQIMMSAYFLFLIAVIKIAITLTLMINAASPKPTIVCLLDMLKKPFLYTHTAWTAFSSSLISAVSFPAPPMHKTNLPGMSPAFTAIYFTPRIFSASFFSSLRSSCDSATFPRTESLLSSLTITDSLKRLPAIFANNINKFVGHNIYCTIVNYGGL